MPASSISTTCRVCHRPLRAAISVALGVGPVCVKRAREVMATLQAQMRDPSAGAIASFEQQYGLAQEELRLLSERTARTAFLERSRRGRSTRPTTEQVVVTSNSRTRRSQNETLNVEWITDDTALIHSSGSGRTYSVTEHSCTCRDYRYHVVRHPDQRPNGCRHMEAYRGALGILGHQHTQIQPADNAQTSEAARPATITPNPQIVVATREILRPGFAGIDYTDEALREQVLSIWRENRAWDGVRMRDDQVAFERLMTEADEDWEYITDGSVLGGTGNTFGVELEMEFDRDGAWDLVARDLYNEGLSQYSSRQGYHTSGLLWIPTRDGSLAGGGLEIVSPVLQDRPEDWAQLRRVLEIAKHHGAKVSSRTGCHTNVGVGPQDSRTFSWQRFARATLAHEATLYRIGGANSEAYRNHQGPGKHRGTGYVSPMANDLSFSGNAMPETARQRIRSAGHTSMINTTHDNRIEFRYPNGSLDERQIQAQIIVANAMMHQAAVITNEHPLSDTTPRFSEHSDQIRRNDVAIRHPEDPRRIAEEEKAFRRFLDFLGHSANRKAAAWLWKRGTV